MNSAVSSDVDIVATFTVSEDSMSVGERTDLTVTIKNAGTVATENVRAHIPVPGDFRIRSSSLSGGSVRNYDRQTGVVTWDALAPGSSGRLELNLEAVAPTVWTAGILSIEADHIDPSFCIGLGDPSCGGTATITVTGELAIENTTVRASPTTVVADGGTASTVTVTLRDNQGGLIGEAGHTVELTPTLGTTGEVTDNGDGTYSAPWTSTELGTGTVSVTVDGIDVPETAAVRFVPGPVSAEKSSTSVTAGSVRADGSESHTITVALAHSTGHPAIGQADLIRAIAAEDLGEGGITDFEESTEPGIYTAAITSTVSGVKTITASFDGAEITMTGDGTATFAAVGGGENPGPGGEVGGGASGGSTGHGSDAGSGAETGSASTAPSGSGTATADSLARTGSDVIAPITSALIATLVGAALFGLALVLRRRRSAE